MKKLFMSALVVAALGSAASAQMDSDPAKIRLEVSRVAGSVSMITGVGGFAGGNVGVSVGEDGVFVIDDEIKPMTPKLKAAVATLSKQPPRFLINTHWHGDHAGGNEGMAESGAILVAHDNVRERMSAEHIVEFGGEQEKIPASPAKALPILTFSQEVTFHLNGDVVHVFHVANAHTDGDAIVHFRKANVIHMGDTFVTMGYPFIDLSSGGSVEGFIKAADRVLPLCNDSTKIIPGHGPLADRKKLTEWRQMLVKIRDRVAAAIAKKQKLEQVKAAKPTAEFDAVWGQGFLKPDEMVEVVFRSLTTPKGK